MDDTLDEVLRDDELDDDELDEDLLKDEEETEDEYSEGEFSESSIQEDDMPNIEDEEIDEEAIKTLRSEARNLGVDLFLTDYLFRSKRSLVPLFTAFKDQLVQKI